MSVVCDVIDDADEDGRNLHLEAEQIIMAMPKPIYEMWAQWRRWGRLPQAGGWLDQPLSIMVQMAAIELVYNTWRGWHDKTLTLSKATSEQRQIIAAFTNR